MAPNCVLCLRPELIAFEQVLQQTIARFATLEDERFARPRRLESDDDGGLSVVSDLEVGAGKVVSCSIMRHLGSVGEICLSRASTSLFDDKLSTSPRCLQHFLELGEACSYLDPLPKLFGH